MQLALSAARRLTIDGRLENVEDRVPIDEGSAPSNSVRDRLRDMRSRAVAIAFHNDHLDGPIDDPVGHSRH